MDAANKGVVKLSGFDALSYFYNTRKGGAKLTGAIYWFFHRQVTVSVARMNQLSRTMRDTVFIKTFLRTRNITNLLTNTSVLPRMSIHNGCGAQSLRQAAVDLGVMHLPQGGAFRGQSIKGSQAEQAIFDVTMKPVATGGGDSIKPINGYASVAHILAAARTMGLQGRLYSSHSNWVSMHLVRPEAGLWRQINGFSSIKMGSAPGLGNNERLIVHCKAGDRGHFVMQRPDGRFYDPATGALHSSRTEFIRRTGWALSGWSILLRRAD